MTAPQPHESTHEDSSGAAHSDPADASASILPQDESSLTAPRPSKKRFEWTSYRLALLGVLAVCAFTRFWAIGHDLPFSYYPDEAHFVKRSVAFGSGDLNPHWFHKPAFFMYVLFFEYGLLFCYQWVTGTIRSVDEFALRFLSDPTPFYMLGRITSALFGLGGVYLAYRIGRFLRGPWTGVAAAATLTAVFAHNVSSMEVKADLASSFFTLLSFWFLLLVARNGRWKYVVLAGIAAGIGMATKYYSVFLFIPMLFAVFLNTLAAPREIDGLALWKRAVSRYAMFVTMTVLFFAFFFLCSPFNYLDPLWYDLNMRPMLRNRFNMLGPAKIIVKVFHLFLGGEFSRGSLGVTAVLIALGGAAFSAISVLAVNIRRSRWGGRAWGLALPLGFAASVAALTVLAPHFREHFVGFFLTLMDTQAMGFPLGALALVGCVFLALRARAEDLLLLTPIFAFALIASFYLHQVAEPRHLNTAYPLFAVVVALLFTEGVPALAARTGISTRNGLPVRIGVTAGFVLFLAPGLYGIVDWNRIQAREDTRTVAVRWFEANIESGADVLVDKECIKLWADEETVQRMIEQLDAEIERSKKRQTKNYEDGVEPFLVHKGQLYVWEKTIARDRRERGRATYGLRILAHPWWAPREREDGNYLTDLDRDIGDPLAERTPKTLDEYRAEGVDYIVTESGRYRQILNEDWRRNWPSWDRFYSELLELEPVMEFPAEPGYRAGPTVRVYKL